MPLFWNRCTFSSSSSSSGFTLVELLVVVCVIGILSAISVPAFSSIYADCCLKSTAHQLAAMMRDGKQNGLDGHDYAVVFDTATSTVSLHSSRGADGQWRTSDDTVARSIKLPAMIHFGFGSCGPIPGLAAPVDGISFQNNIMVCNGDLTGNAGAVYLSSPSGAAMAIVVNSTDFSYSIRRWDGSSWVLY